MIRFIAGALVMVAAAYIGTGIDRYYKSRARLLSDTLAYMENASREVAFMKTGVIGLTELNVENTALKKILSTIGKTLASGGAPVAESVYLTKSEKRAFEDFFKGLTVSDYEGQKQVFAAFKTEFERAAKKADKEIREKGELSKKLFALAGLALLIIIV